MRLRFLGLISAVFFSVAAMGAPHSTLDTKIEQEDSSFKKILEHWEHLVHFGGYTPEEAELARKKVYEILRAYDESGFDGRPFKVSTDSYVFQIRADSIVTLAVQYGGKYAEFEDHGSDGMKKGTEDKIRVPWGEDQVWEYPLDREAKVVAYYYNSENGMTKDLGLVYWRKDVEDLTYDFNTAMVLNYFKFLEASDNGTFMVDNKEHNLLK